MKVVFVHGACVRDGSWWWHRTAEVLARRGLESVTPLLPSCGEGPGRPGAVGSGLRDDIASVRQTLEALNEPVVVVTHSYGGIVTAEAAAGLNTVQHLLLVSSYLPEVGESLSSFGSSDGPAPFLEVDFDAGTFGARREMFVDTFMQDCSPELAREATDYLAAQSLSVTQEPVQAAAWHQIPSTYLVCTQDRGTPATAQRTFAERAGSVIDIDAGHHPFLSQPDFVADVVVSLA